MKIRHALHALAALALAVSVAGAAVVKPPAQPAAAKTPPAQPALQAETRPGIPAPIQLVPPLEQAKNLYAQAQFDEAVAVLNKALKNGGVTGDDVNAARALRARCLVKLGRRLEAKEGFKAVLRSDPAFRLDPNEVPPDEMDTFKLAAQEIDSEQFEAGKRFPASIAFNAGKGSAVNQDLVDLASSAGVEQADDFAEKIELGYSVRFPLKPRLSIDFEVQRLRATTEDKLPPSRNAHATYKATGQPFVISLVRNFSGSPTRHLNGFVGVGPMTSEAIVEYKQALVAGRLIPSQIVGEGLGWYFHAGVEGEWLLQPRFALTGRVLARRANSGRLHWPREDFQIYDSYDASSLGNRSVDFSGFSASVGVRAYIGY